MSNANKKSRQNREGQVRHLPKNSWLYFILAVLLVYFLVFIGQPLSEGAWCLLNDYMGYYSAGQIMNTEGASAVYDLDLLAEYQANLYLACGHDPSNIETLAMLYLPVFFLPFQLLALVDYPVSVVFWIVINFTILVFYLLFFTKELFGKRLSLQALIMVLVSIPVFRNFIHGQVNLLLLLAMGEFARALMARKDVKAGLWLSGLMIKPQVLVLLVPFMLIQKKWKVLRSFLIAVVLMLGVSYLVVGWGGVIGFRDSILTAAKGGGSSHYELMVNWRAVSYFIAQFSGLGLGRIVLIIGSLVTMAMTLIAFRKKIEVDSPLFMVALLGVTAATTLVTYHIHTHSAMILIPLLLYLNMNGTLSGKLLNFWFLTPSVFNFLQFMVGALVVLSILPFNFAYFANFPNGLVLFVLNLILLGWAITQARTKEEESLMLSM